MDASFPLPTLAAQAIPVCASSLLLCIPGLTGLFCWTPVCVRAERGEWRQDSSRLHGVCPENLLNCKLRYNHSQDVVVVVCHGCCEKSHPRDERKHQAQNKADTDSNRLLPTGITSLRNLHFGTKPCCSKATHADHSPTSSRYRAYFSVTGRLRPIDMETVFAFHTGGQADHRHPKSARPATG